MHTKHRVTSERMTGYSAPAVDGEHENQAAHGGVAYHQTCSCGATRVVNANGRAVERGPWVQPRIVEGSY